MNEVAVTIVHYSSLRYITLHYITVHYITLHYSACLIICRSHCSSVFHSSPRNFNLILHSFFISIYICICIFCIYICIQRQLWFFRHLLTVLQTLVQGETGLCIGSITFSYHHPCQFINSFLSKCHNFQYMVQDFQILNNEVYDHQTSAIP